MAKQPLDEIAVLCDEIQALLDTPPVTGKQSLAGLEDTLTEGYARALALEAERWRLERRIGELGAEVRRGPDGSADELVSLASRLSAASGQLAKLRALLVGLRRRTDDLRAGRPYATVEHGARSR